MTAEWNKVSDETPDEFVTVFFVNPEEGVTIGYYNGMYWKDSEGNKVWPKVAYWMPIEYPKAPEGAVDTDWD